jgi:glycopeptide antibiotics resistance protein
MIPAIGIMVGAYIITRMMEILAKAESKNVTKVFSVVTILVTLVSVVDLLNAGSSFPRG